MMSASISTLPPEVFFSKAIEGREFVAKGEVWVKSSEFELKNEPDEIRLSFYKIGKTFGWHSKRILGVRRNYLVYYEDEEDTAVKGHCCLSNLYCAFFKTEEKNPYLLYLTNFSHSALLYFPQLAELNKLRTFIAKWVIQLNFTGQFEILDKIGEGSFSKVHLARKLENNHEYAVKIVKKLDKNNNKSKQAVQQQKTALSLLYSDYISKMYEFYEDNQQFYFVLEYIPGKNLMALIKENIFMSLETRKSLMKSILIALAYAHSRNVIHRDLKPQNIIVNLLSERPKIIDLGLSLILGKDPSLKSFKRCGTMGYIAPQVIANTSENRKPYDTKADMFSFGIIAHMLLLQKNPLKGRNYEETFVNNKNCNLSIDQPTIIQKYGQLCYDMISRLLCTNPENRLTARETLEHQFFKTIGKEEYRTTATEKEMETIQKQIKRSEFVGFDQGEQQAEVEQHYITTPSELHRGKRSGSHQS